MRRTDTAHHDVYAGMKPAEAAGIEVLRREIAATKRDGVRPRVEINAKQRDNSRSHY